MVDLARRVWRGGLPLWLTYWVFGVAGNMTFIAILLLLFLAARDVIWLWAVCLLSLAWFVWIFAGIWRSAGRYPGPHIWALLARLGVSSGVVRMVAEVFLIASFA